MYWGNWVRAWIMSGWHDFDDSISRLALNRNFEMPGKRHVID